LDNITEYLRNLEEVQFQTKEFVIALLISLVFGMALKSLYTLYFRDNEPQDGSLARSLVLITPALTTLFWMIQTNAVLSLGLLGSMSFVRFRTPVKRPEDVSFIVLALAVAVSCAIQIYIIGVILLFVFLVFTLARTFFGDGFAKKGQFAIITFNTKKPISVRNVSEELLSIGIKCEFVSSRSYDGITSMVFNASKLGGDSHDEIRSCLVGLDEIAHINIFLPNDRLGA